MSQQELPPPHSTVDVLASLDPPVPATSPCTSGVVLVHNPEQLVLLGVPVSAPAPEPEVPRFAKPSLDSTSISSTQQPGLRPSAAPACAPVASCFCKVETLYG